MRSLFISQDSSMSQFLFKLAILRNAKFQFESSIEKFQNESENFIWIVSRYGQVILKRLIDFNK